MKYNIQLFRLSIFSLFILVPFSLFSQLSNQQIEKMITADFDSTRLGGIRNHNYHFDSSNERYFLDFVKKYEHDQSQNVRSRLQDLNFVIALNSIDTLIRQQVVEGFIIDGSDPEPSISQHSFERLLFFKEHDFSNNAKKIMFNMFNKQNYTNDFILSCGTAQIKQLIPQLKILASNFDRTKEGWYSTIAWYASVALTRMDNIENVDAIIAAVELELNPNLRVIWLLRYIAYTKISLV